MKTLRIILKKFCEFRPRKSTKQDENNWKKVEPELNLQY